MACPFCWPLPAYSGVAEPGVDGKLRRLLRRMATDTGPPPPPACRSSLGHRLSAVGVDGSTGSGHSTTAGRQTYDLLGRDSGVNVSVSNCPACGSQQRIADGAAAFRCGSCQRDVWILRCHKCHNGCRIYGSATGAGALEFRCGRRSRPPRVGLGLLGTGRGNDLHTTASATRRTGPRRWRPAT